MRWNYVAVRKVHPNGDIEYAVHEDFWQDGYGYTVDPVEPTGETLDELLLCLRRMAEDVAAFPVIEEKLS